MLVPRDSTAQRAAAAADGPSNVIVDLRTAMVSVHFILDGRGASPVRDSGPVVKEL